MAYTKQTWATGDVITAEKLNHMEDGIGDSNMIVNVTATFPSGISGDNQLTNIQSDKTTLEILSAIQSGKIVTLKLVSDAGGAYTYFIPLSRIRTAIFEDEQAYTVAFQDVRCGAYSDLGFAEFTEISISFDFSEYDEQISEQICGDYSIFSCNLRSQA